MINTGKPHKCEHCKQPLIMSGDHVMLIFTGVTTVNRTDLDHSHFVETDKKLVHQSCFVRMFTEA